VTHEASGSAALVVCPCEGVTSREIELASLNTAYASVTVRRTRSTVLGTVLARFTRR